MKLNVRSAILLVVLTTFAASASFAQEPPPEPKEVPGVESIRDITYSVPQGQELKLDVFRPATRPAVTPVLVSFHGGGWVKNSRPTSPASFRPYFAMGFSVVNVDYRLAAAALAPGAVQDARCAIAWVQVNAGKYGFDTSRIVVTGTSAGGHLALMAGLLSRDAGMDRACAGPVPKVAAIVDFYGITDVNDLLTGTNVRNWAKTWIGSGADTEKLAKSVSPLSYVTKTSPPVLIVHGDADPTVPYEHAVRLHKALDEAGVVNKLHTVKGGLHGKFSDDEKKAIVADIVDFLAARGITAKVTERKAGK